MKNPEKEIKFNLKNETILELVLIKKGSFQMGSSTLDKGLISELGHPVNIHSFYMSKYQITQKQYLSVMEKNPSYFYGYHRPVEKVNWFEAIRFCNKLSIKNKLQPVYLHNKESDTYKWPIRLDINSITYDISLNGFRLPTEAEWEYAAKAGSTTDYYWGDKINNDYLWYSGNFCGLTMDVGTKLPNQWNLYDMSGNVWEWCNDWYSDDYYPYCLYEGTITNPIGPEKGKFKVARGGCWFSDPYNCMSAHRYFSHPGDFDFNIGFRIVRTI